MRHVLSRRLLRGGLLLSPLKSKHGGLQAPVLILSSHLKSGFSCPRGGQTVKETGFPLEGSAQLSLEAEAEVVISSHLRGTERAHSRHGQKEGVKHVDPGITAALTSRREAFNTV